MGIDGIGGGVNYYMIVIIWSLGLLAFSYQLLAKLYSLATGAL